MNIYDNRNAFSLQQKKVVLVAFQISKLRELKNLGPWKLMESFLIFLLHCGKLKSSELQVPYAPSVSKNILLKL